VIVPPPRIELIEGIFREAQLVTISGTFGAGKSPLLAEWAFCLTTGLRWCGRRVQRRPVLMLAHETPAWAFWRGWAAMGERHSLTPPDDPATVEMFLEAGSDENVSTAELLNVLAKSMDERMKWLESKVAAKPDAVVMVDPFNMFFPVDTKKGMHIMVVYKWCRMLHRTYPGLTFVFTFNTRKKSRIAAQQPSLIKDPRDWLEEASGGMEIQSRSDVRLGLEYKGDAGDRIFFFNGWRRGEDMEPMMLESVILGSDEEGKPKLAGFKPAPLREEDDLTAMLTDRQAELWRMLPPGEFTVADLEGDDKLSRASAYNMRTRLVRLGLVTDLGGGRMRKEG